MSNTTSNTPTLTHPITQHRMTSLEIAELANKNHKDVLRDIRNLIDQAAINERDFALVDYKDAKGEKRPMYSLDFRATMVLITGYDVKRRSLVIDRWIDLETGEATPAMMSEAQSRRLNIMKQEICTGMALVNEQLDRTEVPDRQRLELAGCAIEQLLGDDVLAELGLKEKEPPRLSMPPADLPPIGPQRWIHGKGFNYIMEIRQELHPPDQPARLALHLECRDFFIKQTCDTGTGLAISEETLCALFHVWFERTFHIPAPPQALIKDAMIPEYGSCRDHYKRLTIVGQVWYIGLAPKAREVTA